MLTVKNGVSQWGMTGSEEVSADVDQGYSDTCAIRSQQLILNDFGIDVSQEELINQSIKNGWYTPDTGGTLFTDIGKLLESHGVDVKVTHNANIFNLTSELAQGKRVIIGVDSGELWSSNSVLEDISEAHEDATFGGIADHALIVSGVDASDPNNPLVVITDPGTGHAAKEYPLDEFLDAWEDSGYTMWSTENAPADFGIDHVPNIGELPYEYFVEFYPSVEHLSGLEEFFSTLCQQYDMLINQPYYYDEFSIGEYIPEYTMVEVTHPVAMPIDGIVNQEMVSFDEFTDVALTTEVESVVEDILEDDPFDNVENDFNQENIEDICSVTDDSVDIFEDDSWDDVDFS